MRRPVLATLLLLAAAGLPAHAEEAAAPAGVLTRAPSVIEPTEPEYPPEARAQGLTGAVTLEIEIDERGEVTDAVVTGPAGHGFDEAALAAARRLRFSPAEIDGKPAAVRIEYRFTFTLAAPAAAQAAAEPPPANLRGRVLERGTRLPVVAALVEAGGRSAYTDRDGRFALAVPLGKVTVAVSEAAHARLESDELLEEGQATEVTYWVRRTALGEYEAVVTGKREEREVAQVALSAGEIRKVPGVLGDTVKVIQNLPGVARAPFGSGQLVIRGGNARDTNVYVDGHQVPQVFHFGGLTSIYSSELIQEVEFQPGNFGVTSGRAIGGRVNLVTRDPGERTHVVADANLYGATALWEGRPREDLGLALAARRSYADFVIAQAAKQAEDGPHVSVAPRYYDFQAKAAWKVGPDDTLRLDAFGSNDKMVLTGVKTDGLKDLNVLSYGSEFYQAGLRWDRRVSDATRVHVALGGGWEKYAAQVSDIYKEDDTVWNTTFRAELRQELAPWLKVVSGVDGQWDPQAQVDVTAPDFSSPGQVPSPDDTPHHYRKALGDWSEVGAFVQATVEPLPNVFLVPGVRFDVHHSLKTLSWTDPRLSVRWQLRPSTALKAAAGLYHQAPPVAYLTEEWGNPALTAEGAWQYSVGAEHHFSKNLSLDVEVYYKRLFDLALPTDATIVRDGQPVAENYRSAGTGKAYGAEILLRWDPDGRFFGWLAYSLSRSKRDQSVAGSASWDDSSAYDQPHNLIAVGTVELPEVWDGLSAGFRLQYTTGNRYERIHSAVFDSDSDAYQGVETGNLSSRMPDFFKLDLRADKKWTYRTWSLTAYLDVQNATNRKNPEAVAYSYDYSQRGWVTGLPFFPSLGVRAEY